MCNQRERLIGYVYSEGDAAERDEVQRHLESCPECRTEIAALRSVREDLLAWDVPAYESVWRPFAPAPVATPWWRQVPAWAMAAAATVVLASGFAGGSFAHGLNGEPVQSPRVVTSQAAPELAAFERLITQMREELVAVDARVQRVANRPGADVLRTGDESDVQVAELTQRIAKLTEMNTGLVTMLNGLNGQLQAAKENFQLAQANLDSKLNSLQNLVDKLASLK